MEDAPDSEQDFRKGYDGKDVVVQNLRQVCVFKVAKDGSKKPCEGSEKVTRRGVNESQSKFLERTQPMSQIWPGTPLF
jgi:hypothetical protein